MNSFVDRRDGNSNPSNDKVEVELIRVANHPPEKKSEERSFDRQSGRIGWALLWLLGIPLPVLIVIYLIWGR